MAEHCTVLGCNQLVSKPGYKLCYKHWKVNNSKVSNSIDFQPHSQAPSSTSTLLSATKISERLGLSRKAINPIFAEIGLLDKVQNGWLATRLGLSFGAVQKYDEKDKKPYVVWPEEIFNNQIFMSTFRKVSEQDAETKSNSDSGKLNFREKFQAGNYRATDGHWVRSKAELSIDNWLYMAGLVHAYERKLPIEEEVYCDFYIPSGRVYIEYWGYEDEPEYASRKREKQHIYQKYEFNLIELNDEHIKNLDDYLPKMLRGFGIVVE
ncbi:hypothetical protein [Calothrix sp. NIES-2098]|uniref:hypothetical protein n=1 Tax=Calothrix sp. NIES-2098 TaxID=1954171 RepID=UPI000B5FBFF8|nr:hypothetical protein NIES2098_28490 [Calothrix sp. NIES-2098]